MRWPEQEGVTCHEIWCYCKNTKALVVGCTLELGGGEFGILEYPYGQYCTGIDCTGKEYTGDVGLSRVEYTGDVGLFQVEYTADVGLSRVE